MEVTAQETSLKNVLDQYYSWLVDLMGPTGDNRVALLSTIVTHDIIRDAPLYTHSVFKAFVDRTISISPEDFGPGNYADLYSRRYSDLVALAGYELYVSAKYSDQQVVDLQRLAGDITEAIKEINGIRRSANEEFNKVATDLGLKPGTPEYDLQRANVFSPYLTLIRIQRDKITRAESNRLAIHLAVFKNDREAAQLASIFERCIAESSYQYLPTSDDVERIYKLDPIKIGEAAHSGLYPFSRELGIDSSGSLTRILDLTGKRNVEFTANSTATHNHDLHWKASAGGRWGIFRGKVSSSAESHFRQSLQNLESISIGCEYMAEYWVKRRDWFDTTIFKNKYVADHIKNRPDVARALALCIASAVIVRGLKITYKFKSVNDTKVWSSWDAKASGGFKAFGISFGGIGGGGSGSKFDHKVDEKNKTVTFEDGSDVCRLLALRAAKVIDVSDESISMEGKYLDETPAGEALLKAWRDGSLGLNASGEELLPTEGER